MDSHAEIISLLQKLSQDNERLHSEMASLRQETSMVESRLQSRMDDVVSKLKEYIPNEIGYRIEDTESKLKQAISDEIRLIVGTVEDSISTAISDELGDLDSSLTNTIVGVFQDGLEEMEGSMCQTVSDRVSKESKTIRGDVASLSRALESSQSFHQRPHCQPEFTCFSKLPPEIRFSIWKRACFEPSVVKLHADCPDGTFHGFYFSGYKLPAVLQTTRESRQEALKYYKKTIIESKNHRDFTKGLLARNPKCPKYFNFSADILYLVIDESWHEAWPEACWAELVTKLSTLREFRRVAISDSQANESWWPPAKFLSKPRSRIKEVLVVMDGDNLLETGQWLAPLKTRENPLSHNNNSLASSIAERANLMPHLLDADDAHVDDDGELKEDPLDPPSLFEIMQQLATKSASAGELSIDAVPKGAAGNDLKAEAVKRLPEITYVTLKNFLPAGRIHLD